MIAGGGTAGHVNPAIALARAMPGDDVSFVGTASGAEARLVPAAGFPIENITVAGFDRAKPWLLPRTGMRAAGAVAAARGLLQRSGPAAVVGMGGYVSLPAVLAARSLSVPVVLHEQNIVFGLAHKVSKPFAARIAVSFQETLEAAGRKGVYVGNPVAPEFATFSKEAHRERALQLFDLDPARKTLLVFGGSQGARRINDAAHGLADAWSGRTDVQVLHIAGRLAYPELQQRTSTGAGLAHYRLVEFVEDMPLAYAAADLALCRGGATTLAELAVVGLPAIVVPYPYHRDRQQERQARVAERAGAALVMADAETTTSAVADAADRLLRDEARLKEMSQSFLALARPDAAQRLADVVRGVVR
ncbi:MAG: undecaprenyldiphospho-muramoylpentapeptide beta-N-acetylglucosaminyltransferase [Actinomycetota bacterium]|nr:undecaprenyldiphospho-muramoylpentapeptide beta-N-acetylglucosaminyltransferase [Actinomycetota bacterium]